jgi:hypothetical protein
MEQAAEQAALPFQLLEQLKLPCGYERSFKMLDGKILANRFLLGVNVEQLTREKLLTICQRLNMPQPYIDSLFAKFADANLVFLGFEDNEPGCIYRVYLEFWEKLKADIANKSDKSAPAALHLGFKWNADDNTQRTTSTYTCYPLLSVREIQGRLADLYRSHEDSVSSEVVTEIVALAASRSVDHSFVYVEVEEDNNPRKSFDLNLYSAMIELREVRPILERLRENYEIPADKFDRLFRLVGDKLFGHLSGGVNRQAVDFLTVYFEA